MPISLPTVTADPTKSIIPKKSYVTLTPTVGGVAGTPVSFIGKVADYSDDIATAMREMPDADGFVRPDREVPKTRKQSFKFELEDVKLLGSAFGGTTLEGGLARGTAELFIIDQDDATTNASIHTNIFKASWRVDGGMKLTAGEPAKVTLLINALEKIVLTPNVTLT